MMENLTESVARQRIEAMVDFFESEDAARIRGEAGNAEVFDTVHLMRRAIDNGRPAAAAWYGMHLGVIAQTAINRMLYQQHEEDTAFLLQARRTFRDNIQVIDAAQPTLKRGREVLDGARKGGPATRKAPPDAELCAAVTAMHEAYPHLKWTPICERVAKEYGLVRSTVATRAAAADWRKHRRKRR